MEPGQIKPTYPAFLATVHPADRKAVSRAVEQALKTNDYSVDHRIVLPNGEVRFVHEEGEVIYSDAGEPVRMNGVAHDVTAARQAEEALRESKERLDSFMESATDGFVLFDADLMLREINRASIKLFPDGTRKEDLIGKHLLELNPAMEKSGRYKEYLKVIKTGKPFFVDDFIPGPNFGDIHLSVRAFKVGDGLGIISIDVSERKEWEVKIKASLHEKEVLLKEIHHRVKNNLQIISSLLHLQSEKLASPELAAVFIESQNRVKSMALLHENLYQSGNLSRIDVREYIKNLAAYLSQTYDPGSRGVALTVDVDDVSLDLDTAIPLGLIINELVTNALKHAFPDDEQGQIKVELRKGNEKHSLIVRDDGVGLVELPEIGQTKSLGLELVHNLVEQLDGALKVRSNPGTEFEITF